LRESLFTQHLERARVAEEAGDTDQEVAKERIHLGRGLPQIACVRVQSLDLVDGMRRSTRRGDGVLLVPEKSWPVWARSGREPSSTRPLAWIPVRRTGGRFAEDSGNEVDELGRHLGWRQHIVHQAGGDGVARMPS